MLNLSLAAIAFSHCFMAVALKKEGLETVSKWNEMAMNVKMRNFFMQSRGEAEVFLRKPKSFHL